MRKTNRSQDPSKPSNKKEEIDNQHEHEHEHEQKEETSSALKKRKSEQDHHSTNKNHNGTETNGHHHHQEETDDHEGEDGDNVDEKLTVNGCVRPIDWPSAKGLVDLKVHDLPHSSSDTEWWYVHSHLKTEQGREFSIFASFFRIVKEYDRQKQQYKHVHALTWAVVDVQNKRYLTDPLVDKLTPSVIKKQIEDNEFQLDSRMSRAFYEVAQRGNVPLPDHMFSGPVEVATDKLDLDFSGQKYYKDEQGNYICECDCKSGGFGFSLKFTPKKAPIRYGHGGVVKIGVKGDDMFYYFIPRNEVVGELWVDGKKEKVHGSGWYDHEFGGVITAPRNDEEELKRAEENKTKLRKDYGWNWLAIQLDDGTDITATTVFKPASTKTKEAVVPVVVDNFAVIITPDSKKHLYKNAEFKGITNWFSVKTTHDYPSVWKLTIPKAQVDLTITAAFENQEFISILARPAFWEGRMKVEGVINGKHVTGKAFVERHLLQESSLDLFFKKISELARVEIEKTLPYNPTQEQYLTLIGEKGRDNLLEGADLNVFKDTVIRPIREIADRGGKAWRSYCILVCIDAVGGDSSQYAAALAMPEIMHVGSLIIDDIQDKSEVRRGGPTCHKVYGEAVAINCGTAAYFLGMLHLRSSLKNVSDKDWLTFMDSYFLTLRAGHAGQAFDIHGVQHLVPDVLESGDSKRLQDAILCTHRLKSAVPASNLARMGALLGKGSDVQQNALSDYFEAVGVAFQIVDDILNLKGLPGKTRGEDLTAGKITYPVSLALDKAYLKTKEERIQLLKVIDSKSSDPVVIDGAIKVIEECGALKAADEIATNMVELAWCKVNNAIEDSFFKITLRAFGWYVLERHY